MWVWSLPLGPGGFLNSDKHNFSESHCRVGRNHQYDHKHCSLVVGRFAFKLVQVTQILKSDKRLYKFVCKVSGCYLLESGGSGRAPRPNKVGETEFVGSPLAPK